MCLGDSDGWVRVCCTAGDKHNVTNSPSEAGFLEDSEGGAEVCGTTGDNLKVANSPSVTVCLGY